MGKICLVQNFNKLWQGTLAQTVYPIIGPSMITETIADIYSG